MNETTRLPLDRSPVPPLPESAPKGCVFSCEWGKDRRDLPDGNLHRKVNSFITMATELGGRQGKGGHVHGVRSLGSATLDLCKFQRSAVQMRLSNGFVFGQAMSRWDHSIYGGKGAVGMYSKDQ